MSTIFFIYLLFIVTPVFQGVESKFNFTSQGALNNSVCCEIHSTSTSTSTTTTTTTYTKDVMVPSLGLIRGLTHSSYDVFLGVRYTDKPDRFKMSSEKMTSWDGVMNATSYGAICPQNTLSGPQNEDCLFLNIWTPKKAAQGLKKYPVFMFIHGGSFTIGEGSEVFIDGQRYAEKETIMVSINYRLGILGFMAHSELSAEDPEHPTNFGLYDQMTAIRWIKAYISNFGGNPDDLTVIGQSAGGASVQWLLHSQTHAKQPLFGRAILQSAPTNFFSVSLKEAENLGQDFSIEAGCDETTVMAKYNNSVVSCLRNLSIDRILELTTQPRSISDFANENPRTVYTIASSPHYDGVEWLDHPILIGKEKSDRFKGHEIIIGSNEAEYTTMLFTSYLIKYPADTFFGEALERFFSAEEFSKKGFSADSLLTTVDKLYPSSVFSTHKQKLEAVFGDIMFTCPTRKYARRMAREGASVRRYVFKHVPSDGLSSLSSCHMCDIFFTFQKPFPVIANGYVKIFVNNFTEEDLHLSDHMIDSFIDLGHTDELKVGRINWPKYDGKTENGTMVWKVGEEVDEEGFRESQCDFWDSVFPEKLNMIKTDMMEKEQTHIVFLNEQIFSAATFLIRKKNRPILAAIFSTYLLSIVGLIYACCRRKKTQHQQQKVKYEDFNLVSSVGGASS
eukprot:TRINITY_DN3874_c0_g2_i2.p1 TRINITY_DN3874_c0_g2~~TRINITY_DN3874_c0_g2_i2.p1  ORF type:complete len:698 (-),score=151.85 TRINITY_DN3874_c0_g2_i2:40-2064(-)